MTWRLEGYDTFSDEPYPLDGKYGDGCQPSYPGRDAALADAFKRLRELERTQPSSSSGGQSGIQDRVYLIHPDGHRERVYPWHDRPVRSYEEDAEVTSLLRQYDQIVARLAELRIDLGKLRPHGKDMSMGALEREKT